jgi:hypothetical protein
MKRKNTQALVAGEVVNFKRYRKECEFFYRWCNVTLLSRVDAKRWRVTRSLKIRSFVARVDRLRRIKEIPPDEKGIILLTEKNGVIQLRELPKKRRKKIGR